MQLLNSDANGLGAAVGVHPEAIAKSATVEALINSYLLALERDAKPEELHQILSPLTAGDFSHQQLLQLRAAQFRRLGMPTDASKVITPWR